jgi:hypothetical protein
MIYNYRIIVYDEDNREIKNIEPMLKELRLSASIPRIWISASLFSLKGIFLTEWKAIDKDITALSRGFPHCRFVLSIEKYSIVKKYDYSFSQTFIGGKKI